MEQIDNSREYIYIFKEQFDYLDVLTDSQFTRLFRLIRDLRFNGIDTKPKDIDDLMLRGIWISLRPQILASARNARKYKKRQEKAAKVDTPKAKKEEKPQPAPVKEKPVLPELTDREKDLEVMFRAKLKQGNNRKWITEYTDIIDAINGEIDFAEWLNYTFNHFKYTENELDNVWNRLRSIYENNNKPNNSLIR